VKMLPTPTASDSTTHWNDKIRFDSLSAEINRQRDSVMWLTPSTVQIEPTEGRREKRKAYRLSIGRKDVAGCLAEQVATPEMWPTQNPEEKPAEMESIGSLNPEWVEWLMGYPVGWTDLKD